MVNVSTSSIAFEADFLYPRDHITSHPPLDSDIEISLLVEIQQTYETVRRVSKSAPKSTDDPTSAIAQRPFPQPKNSSQN